MTSETVLISIILPVYNVEKYIRQCLTSLSEQLYSNIEVIIVDDNSVDTTPDICKEFTEKDKRFLYFRNNTNLGAGQTRQIGIEKAQGDIIGFADGDDWIAPNFVSELYTAMVETNCPIVCCQYYFCYEDGRPSTTPWPECSEKIVVDKYDAIYKMSVYDRIGTELWNKLYRRDIVEKFKMESCHYEDAFILLNYFMEAESICIYCRPLYYYFQREGSLMNSAYTPQKEFAHFKLDAERCFLLQAGEYPCRVFYNKTIRKGVRAFKNFTLLPSSPTDDTENLIQDTLLYLKRLREEEGSKQLSNKNKGEAWVIIHFRGLYSSLYKTIIKLFYRKKIQQLQLRYKITSFEFLTKGFK